MHLLRDPQRGGLDAPLDQPGAKGIARGAQQHSHGVYLITQSLSRRYGSASGVAVSIEEFGQAVDHNVSAKFNGADGDG